jgi:hypothetical protein
MSPIPVLDDENARRPCPTCAKSIKCGATLCGFCWTHVMPVHADGTPHSSWTPPAVRTAPWWKFWA